MSSRREPAAFFFGGGKKKLPLERGGAFCKGITCTPARWGIVCGRLTAGLSHRRVTAGTARRRGVPFTRVRRRGLCSMSGRYPYGIGNPPTLRRSSFPQRALRPVGDPIPKHAWGCAPRPPNAKLRLDTNDAKASSVRRRRYALKVPAAHFYVETVDRVPLPRCGGGVGGAEPSAASGGCSEAEHPQRSKKSSKRAAR